MVQNQELTGNRMPVGHRRKTSDSSATQNVSLHSEASPAADSIGRRRKPETLPSEVAPIVPPENTATVGRRRKPDALVISELEAKALQSGVAARQTRPVGSRRKPDAVVPIIEADFAARRDVATSIRLAPSKVASQYHLRNPDNQPKASPFIKRRLVPAAGFSALVLASVAAFVDVAPLADTSQYKDVITAAAISGTSGSQTSRDLERAPIIDGASARAEVEGKLYVSKDTQVFADAAKDSPVLAELMKGETVKVTGVTEGDWTQIIHKDLPRWVETKLVSDEKPRLLAHEGEISTAPCSRGSSIEARLQPDTIKVYRAVCERFPEIRQYWGQANRGTHSTGHSLDIMVSGAAGHEVAAFLQDRQADLGIKYLIYEQRIWNVEVLAAGWRGMADRGGITANHYDHVHVTTFGNAAK